MINPRICLVGAGKLSSLRIYPYLAPAGGHLVGVCDLDRARAEEKTARYGGRPYTDLAAMLEAEKPDGVLICIGPSLHAKLARQVLEAGIAVYTEKPPSESAAEALDLARFAYGKGLLCTTAFKKRYNRAYSRAKEWLAKFDPSDHFTLSIDYHSGSYDADVLFDFCIHTIDLSGYLFGDATRVFAIEKEAHAYAVSVHYASGAVGSFSFSDGRSFSVPTEEVELTVRGGNFMTVHNSSTWRITENQQPCEWREPPTFISAGDSGHETGHLSEIEDFFAALREGRATTRSTIYESYKSMVLYEAIRDSAATGGVIDLRYEPLGT